MPPKSYLPEVEGESGETISSDIVAEPAVEPAAEALPIATSGELQMMPPSTGLPTARGTGEAAEESADPLGGPLDAIPSAKEHEHAAVAMAAEGETSA